MHCESFMPDDYFKNNSVLQRLIQDDLPIDVTIINAPVLSSCSQHFHNWFGDCR